MRQVEYSVISSKGTWVYSPVGPTAFNIPLDRYLAEMGKQGWDFCGFMPDKDGMTKIILKRYAPAARRKAPTAMPGPEAVSDAPAKNRRRKPLKKAA